MRKLGTLGGIAATLVSATVVLAAAPAPKTPGSAPAGTSSAPTSTPAKSTSAAPAAAPKAAATTWTANVQPLVLQGTASVAAGAHGTAILTMKMQGLAPDQPWAVTVIGGSGSLDSRPVLFRWSSSDIDMLGNGTLRVNLTRAEFASLERARRSNELLVLVSDGARQAYATFAKD